MSALIPDLSSATAVFSDAFQFPGMRLDPHAPAVIERDRLIMAARPGMLRKVLPVRQDATGVYCGGCYAFDTFENARAYGEWVAKEFVLDGKLFLDRPEFLEPTSQVWHIIGAEDFADVATAQHMMRFERWHLPAHADVEALRRDAWPALRSAAAAAGVSTAWLLAEPHEFHPQLGLVTTAPSASPGGSASDPGGPEGLALLESMPSLGGALAASLSGTKVFDRTSWLYMVWFPIADGDTSPDTALWPCSPPMPALAPVSR